MQKTIGERYQWKRYLRPAFKKIGFGISGYSFLISMYRFPVVSTTSPFKYRNLLPSFSYPKKIIQTLKRWAIEGWTKIKLS